jgi:elongation factor P hydroxylase
MNQTRPTKSAFVSFIILRIRCEKWLLTFCCALAGVSIWQLLVLQGEVADARQRVVQVAQQQVMTYLTSNLPQRMKQSRPF